LIFINPAAGYSAGMPLRILHLDDNLVAIDKPAGLLVHPSRLDAQESVTALRLLESELGQRLWPLHRLDKATSGVLLFARDADTARTWGDAFQGGAVQKRYLALVRGWPPEQGEISTPLAKDPERPSTGQPLLDACTRYQRLATLEWPVPDGRHASTRCALVAVQPLTGRRHQIRRHFKQIAHPLIGDSTHGKGPLNRALAAHLGVSRLWLHAQLLAWNDLQIEVPPGAEWDTLTQG
jgi:tRNA pseudouridine65 synthase